MYGCLPSEAVRLRQRCCFSSLNTCWVYLWFIQVWGILLPFLFWPYFLYLSSCILLSVWLLDSTWLLQLENRSTPFSSRLRGQAHWDAFVKSETPHKASRNCSVQPVRRVSRGECSFMKCLWTRVFRFGPFFSCELLMCPVACGSSIVNFFYASKNFNKFWFNISDSIFSTTHVCTFSHVWLFQLFATPWTSGSTAHQGPLPTRVPCPWDFPDKNTGVACHFLLQGIFHTQELSPCLLCLLHWQEDSLPPSHLGIPSI